MSAPQLDPEKLEVALGTAKDQIEGWVPTLATEEETRDAFEKAFHYRGDVTITKKDGSKLDCFIFDRRTGKTLAESVVRVVPKEAFEKLSIPYSEIAGLAFTGRDTAAGKGWEAWVRRYWERRTAGETNIALEPDTQE